MTQFSNQLLVGHLNLQLNGFPLLFLRPLLFQELGHLFGFPQHNIQTLSIIFYIIPPNNMINSYYCDKEHPLEWTKKYISNCSRCGPTQTMARYMCLEC